MQQYTISLSALMLILMTGGQCISRSAPKRRRRSSPADVGRSLRVHDRVGQRGANEKIASTEVHDYWFAEVTPPYRRLQYAFVLTDRDHEDRFYGSSGVCPYHAKTLGPINDYFKFPFVHDIDTFQAPEWVKSTIWYQIFPERFANGREDLSPEGVLPWGSKEPDVNDFSEAICRELSTSLIIWRSWE